MIINMSRILFLVLLLSLCLGFQAFLSAPKTYRTRTVRRAVEIGDVEEVQEQDKRKLKLPIINTSMFEISLEQPFGEAIKSPIKAKEELIQIVSQPVDSLDQHFRIKYLIQVLQATYIPIQTIPFLLLALSGTWKKCYSNMNTYKAVPSLEYEIYQNLTSNSINEGEYIENIKWKYLEPHGQNNFESCGNFKIISKYELTPKGHLFVTLKDHILLPEVVPKDIEQFINDVQRSVPFESFDPNECSVEVLYVDPDLKITKLSGEKYYDVYNIYQRSGESSFATNSCSFF